jgi:hypothetical protein
MPTTFNSPICGNVSIVNSGVVTADMVRSWDTSPSNTSGAKGLLSVITTNAKPSSTTNYGVASAGYFNIADFTNPTTLASDVNTTLGLLQTSQIMPTVPQLNTLNGNLNGSPSTVSPMSTYVNKVNTFQNNVKSEYCYYEQQYFTLVSLYLGAIASSTGASGNTGGTVNTATLQPLVLAANARLNTIVTLINGISRYNFIKISNLNSQLNTQNNAVTDSSTMLRKQAQIFQSDSVSADVNKRMVEYTAEKNRANQNLMAVYFTLNVVAIASLFILAKNI